MLEDDFTPHTHKLSLHLQMLEDDFTPPTHTYKRSLSLSLSLSSLYTSRCSRMTSPAPQQNNTHTLPLYLQMLEDEVVHVEGWADSR